jgi:hypothetical protein
MIAFRDFVPSQLAAPALMKPGTYESLEQVLTAANAWIDSQNIDVLNVETVVLPNLWTPHSGGSADPNRVLQPGFAEAWNQFIRVWYRAS